MCGIAGFLGTHDTATASVIRRQLDLLAHRGPDSFGVIEKPGAVIGQTRLSVIDLVTGDPPIANEDGSVGVAFNGEIYNYASLRRELLEAGHELRTKGDTEVIAHLAENLGPVDLARRLEGMFACAVWDDRRQTLVLIRDRVGKKPLYYWHDGPRFVFASEIKALFAHPEVPKRLNEDAISAYLTFGYVPTPETFYAGVKSLPSGHVLELSPDGAARISEYWRPVVAGADPVNVAELPFDDAAREVRQILELAVSKRLVSDVPLGAFLSGGIDSSAIVGIMSTLTEEPVRTFTIGFEDVEGFDEREPARRVAERFGTDHTEFVVRPNAVDLIEQLVWNYDQPFGDSSAIPTYLLSQLTKQNVTVALSGDGGDELFAGYERFGAALALGRYLKVPAPIRTGAHKVLERIPQGSVRGRVRSARRFTAGAEVGLPDAYLSWINFVGPRDRALLLNGASEWGIADYKRIWQESEGADLLDRLLVLNLRTYLVDDLLQKVDRMSMAHGLEVRSPLLDHHLVEFALRLPRSYRIKGFTLKRILKAAVSDLLPREITDRRKRGFGVPLDRWFRTDLQNYVASMLGSAARVRTHLRGEALDCLLEEHRAGRVHHGQALWALLTLEIFLRREGW
ncbi:MAG: asparagine synthase (glutamine-hydrolyzing) [Actinomycetota bacterium]